MTGVASARMVELCRSISRSLSRSSRSIRTRSRRVDRDARRTVDLAVAAAQRDVPGLEARQSRREDAALLARRARGRGPRRYPDDVLEHFERRESESSRGLKPKSSSPPSLIVYRPSRSTAQSQSAAVMGCASCNARASRRVATNPGPVRAFVVRRCRRRSPATFGNQTAGLTAFDSRTRAPRKGCLARGPEPIGSASSPLRVKSCDRSRPTLDRELPSPSARRGKPACRPTSTSSSR